MFAILAAGVWFANANGWLAHALPLGAFGTAALVWYKLKVAVDSISPSKLAPEAAYTLVAEGFCGQCGHSLRDLPVHDDGCFVCPECGSAWRERRITCGWWLPLPQVERPTAKVRGFQMVAGRANDAEFDELGRLVPLLTLPQIRGGRERSVAGAEEAWRAIEREVRPIGQAIRVCTACVVLAMFLLGAYALWLQMSVAPAMVSGAAGLLVAMGIGIAIVIVRSDLEITSADVARAMARHGRCASCGEALERETGQEHGVTCGHCGSTWIVPAPVSGTK